MRRIAWPVAVYAVLLFASGAAVGAFGHRLYTLASVKADSAPLSPEQFRKAYVEEMNSRLKLTKPQQAQLEEILNSTSTRYQSVREQYRPMMRAIQDEQVARIRGILEASQQAEYEKMRSEREARRKQLLKTVPPPGI